MAHRHSFHDHGGESSPLPPRKYVCNQCGKSYESHTALGGHKTAHRIKPPVVIAAGETSGVRRRDHACYKCNASFVTGQALGGHMRKHYNKPFMNMDNLRIVIRLGNNAVAAAIDDDATAPTQEVRSGGLDFDLNLPPPPPEED